MAFKAYGEHTCNAHANPHLTYHTLDKLINAFKLDAILSKYVCFAEPGLNGYLLQVLCCVCQQLFPGLAPALEKRIFRVSKTIQRFYRPD